MNTRGIKQKRQRLEKYIYNFLASKWFQRFVPVLILGSIATVILSSFQIFSPWRLQMSLFNYFAAFVFTIEYALRIYSAPYKYPACSGFKARLKYIWSFFGLVDLVAIFPFALTYVLWDTETYYLIMMAHIFIIFKLIRYSRSTQLMVEVLHEAKDKLLTAFTTCGILVCFSGILMYYIERSAQPEKFTNIGDSLWWAIVTFTTVGYGDMYPVTPLGRILGALIGMIGIGMIAFPTGIISSAFTDVLQKHKKEEEENEEGE